MDVTEFLERTDHRHLKQRIGCMVNQRLGEYAESLKARRNLLAHQFKTEAKQYSEETRLLVQANVEKDERNRCEWIVMESKKWEEAEAELIKLKEQQWQIENSETHRHLESKKILMETKEAQLYQIASRKESRLKEAYLEKLWHRAGERLNISRIKQDIYEKSLRQILEERTQLANLERTNEIRTQQSAEALAEQRDSVWAVHLATEDDERRKKDRFLKANSNTQAKHTYGKSVR